MKVYLTFEGRVPVNINADPEDAEAWAAEIGKTWKDMKDKCDRMDLGSKEAKLACGIAETEEWPRWEFGF